MDCKVKLWTVKYNAKCRNTCAEFCLRSWTVNGIMKKANYLDLSKKILRSTINIYKYRRLARF